MAEPLTDAHDLMRRLPPARIADSINDVLDIAGDDAEWAESFLSQVDAPLRVAKDPVNQVPYLVCDYNRDGDSYRSPWSNTYDPAMPDGSLPSATMREYEVRANEVLSIYRELYATTLSPSRHASVPLPQISSSSSSAAAYEDGGATGISRPVYRQPTSGRSTTTLSPLRG